MFFKRPFEPNVLVGKMHATFFCIKESYNYIARNNEGTRIVLLQSPYIIFFGGFCLCSRRRELLSCLEVFPFDPLSIDGRVDKAST